MHFESIATFFINDYALSRMKLKIDNCIRIVYEKETYPNTIIICREDIVMILACVSQSCLTAV